MLYTIPILQHCTFGKSVDRMMIHLNNYISALVWQNCKIFPSKCIAMHQCTVKFILLITPKVRRFKGFLLPPLMSPFPLNCLLPTQAIYIQHLQKSFNKKNIFCLFIWYKHYSLSFLIEDNFWQHFFRILKLW